MAQAQTTLPPIHNNVPPALKLSGLVGLDRLDQVFQTLLLRMDEQAQRINELESEVAQRPTHRAIASLEQKINTIVEASQDRFSRLEDRVKQIEDVMGQIPNLSRKLDRCLEALEHKADRQEIAQVRTEVASAMEHSVQELKNQKANATTLKELEEGQQKLYEELIATQNLVACKVDRVELPLLKTAATKVGEMVDFQRRTSKELAQIQKSLEQLQQTVGGKEDTATLLKRMQNINDLLQHRPDDAWLQHHVIEPLRQVEAKTQDLLVPKEMKGMAAKQAVIEKRLTEVQDALEATLKSTSVLATKYQQTTEALKQVTNGADSREKQSFAALQHILEQWRVKIEADSKAVVAYQDQVKSELLDIKRQQVSLDKKVGVAVRFVDWFTEFKMNG